MQTNREEVSVSGIVSFEDYNTYVSFHWRKMRLMFTLISAFLYIPITTYLVYLPFIGRLIGAVVLGLIVWYMIPVLNKFKVKQEFNSDQLIKNEIFITVSKEGVQQKVRKSEANLEWSDIVAIHETKDMFVFYISKNKAILIPQSFLMDGSEKEKLREVIRENAV
ncbi:hypothetical protein AB685_17665 [Bacillus sp. LL01]|uniref:YcxB family protein n=1 Tax=Bacillus sp. LL01 TaxID=1665556 RepID=UPI00064D3884|nr:YcxB family protein [Bacillus sp. LL01]KMJ57230.1 hypothetical protein AB685_17665 [Bacillus sp. LL01]